MSAEIRGQDFSSVVLWRTYMEKIVQTLRKLK